jgi:hypothetical protein
MLIQFTHSTKTIGDEKMNDISDTLEQELVEYLNELAHREPAETVGKVSKNNWCALLLGPFSLTQLNNVIGAIVYNDSEGTVEVTLYDHSPKLLKNWDLIKKGVLAEKTIGMSTG